MCEKRNEENHGARIPEVSYSFVFLVVAGVGFLLGVLSFYGFSLLEGVGSYDPSKEQIVVTTSTLFFTSALFFALSFILSVYKRFLGRMRKNLSEDDS